MLGAPARVVFAVAALAAAPAIAIDLPVEGTKILMKRTASGKERFVLVFRDGFLFPALGGPDDPAAGTPGGLAIDLLSAEQAATFVVPAGTGVPGWTATAGVPSTYRFVNRTAPDAFSDVRLVAMKEGRLLKVVARRTGLPLTQLVAVGVRVTAGTLRSCARFAAPSVRRDAAGIFIGAAAPPTDLDDCSDAALLGMPTSTTTTTIPGACGDGVINQSTEQCDGAALGVCADHPNFLCRPPTVAGECACCADEGPGVQLVGCCNPTDLLVTTIEFGGVCVRTRCDPPFACSAGDVCQPDGSCCAGFGATCALGITDPPTPGNACCAGLACLRPDGAGGLACCGAEGWPCTDDEECCHAACSSGACEPCRPAGAACTTPAQCCAGMCDAGSCTG